MGAYFSFVRATIGMPPAADSMAALPLLLIEIPAYAGMVRWGTGDCWADWCLVWGDNLLDSVMILADSAIWRWWIVGFGGGGDNLTIRRFGRRQCHIRRYIPVPPWTIPAEAGIYSFTGRHRRLNYAAVGGTCLK